MKLEKLWIYPVKSCGPIALTGAAVEACGLQFDRQWMIVDESGEFLTQRTVPILAQIRPQILDEILILHYGDAFLEVPLAIHHTHKTVPVWVWKDHVEAIDLGELASDWLSEVTASRVRLVTMPADAKRLVDANYAHQGETTSFSDGFPFLVLGRNSIEDLNTRILENGGDENMEAERFRTNFLVSDAPAYDEDEWRHFRVGECEFEAVKACARCTIPTLNPQTGERTGAEPLKTLATYRKRDGQIFLGQNLLPRKLGWVNVGDEIEVLTRRS